MVGAKTAAESHAQRSDCFSSEWTILPECLSWAKAGMVYGAKALIRDPICLVLACGAPDPPRLLYRALSLQILYLDGFGLPWLN